MAREILRDEGVVFGAKMNFEEMTVQHDYALSFEDVKEFNGSKYIGSNVKDSYKQVKLFLEQGRKVLFSGTPCQVDALRAFLKKDYEKLYTVDFVCHGVASQNILNLYIKQLESKYNGKIVSLKFRDKAKGYLNTSFCVTVEKEGHTENFYFPSYDNPFGKFFADGKINRASCYDCKYASTKRVSDITLADCVKDLNEEQKENGCSLVMISTEKGAELYNSFAERLTQKQITIERAKSLQYHLTKPASRYEFRDDLLRDAEILPFDELVDKYYSKSSVPKSGFMRRIYRKIRRFFKNCFSS